VDNSPTNQVGSADIAEIIKFDFTDYNGSVDYVGIANTAASAYGTPSYREPTPVLPGGAGSLVYRPVGGFGFDFTKLTGGAKTGDFLIRATYLFSDNTTQSIGYQFTGVAENANGQGNFSKVFVGFDALTGQWSGSSWIDSDLDSIKDAAELANGVATPNGSLAAGKAVLGIIEIDVENNELASPASTFPAEGFNVTNPRFYGAGAQTEIVPDFNYSFGLTLRDADQDSRLMTIAAAIDGTDPGALSTQVLA
jgi:hypothetical protein